MTSMGHCLWIKFIAAPIIPSCRSWLLKIISLSFAVRSKFWIHLLLVCAISGGEIGISLRSFFNLNSFVLDKRFNNWLAKIPSQLFCHNFQSSSVENRVKRTFCSPMSSLILPDKNLQCEMQRLIFSFREFLFKSLQLSFLEFACVKCYLKMTFNTQILCVKSMF